MGDATMELTWDPDTEAWVGDVTRAGPAGTAPFKLDGLWVAFDRVDSGRIVSLSLPVASPGELLLGEAWATLQPPVEEPDSHDGPVATRSCVIQRVNLSDTPLWLASRELSLAAELAEDAERLESCGDDNEAALAYLQLAQVLADLGELAPRDPRAALEQALALRPRLDGWSPNIYPEDRERYQSLIGLIFEWAPVSLHDELRKVIEPVVSLQPRPSTPSERPTATASEDVLTRVRHANELGREALRAEQGEPMAAAQAWRRCAQAWLEVGETGRCALALDRAADAARGHDEAQSIADRAKAKELAPSWVMPMLGGRTGVPHRPLWPRAHGIPSTWSLLVDARRRAARSHGVAVDVKPVLDRPYVVISYARGTEDRVYVERLVKALAEDGITAWYDQRVDPRPDPSADREFQERLVSCAALVVVVSTNAEDSKVMPWEIARAETAGRPVRPILLSGKGLVSLTNIRSWTVALGQLIPSGTFLDQLRADLEQAARRGWPRFTPLLGRALPPPKEFFVGREGPLKEIEAKLKVAQRVAVQAASGVAGIGKSQLAAEYAHLHRRDYGLIAWIDATRPELIADQLADVAIRLGVPAAETVVGTARNGIHTLNHTDVPWLMVFDNAEQRDLAEWLPRSPEGHVIVTSRRAKWPGPSVQVGPIEHGDAVELLAASSPVDRHSADAIVELLGGLPLALEHAAGHLCATGMPPREYLRSLQAADEVLRGMRLGEDLRPVATVWDVSRSDLSRSSPEAADLLRLSAFLGPEPIPFDLYTQNWSDLRGPLHGAAQSRPAFTRAVEQLAARGLVRHTEKSLTVHRLLARAVRRTLDDEEQQELASTVRGLLARHLPVDGASADNTPARWRELMPHVLSAVDAGPRPEDPGRTSWLLARAGSYLRTEGETGAGPLLVRAVRIDEERHGPDHPFVARRLSSLGVALNLLSGQAEKARPLLERALKIDERALGRDHPWVAYDLRRLAGVFADLNQLSTARELLEEARSIDESVLGADSPEFVDDLTALAEVLRRLGESDAATMLENRATSIERAADAAGRPTADPNRRAPNLGAPRQPGLHDPSS